MKSLAFVIVGLALGLLVAITLFKSGAKITFNNTSPNPSAASSATPTTSATPEPSPSETVFEAGGKYSFATYKGSYPSDWIFKKEPQFQGENLSLTSGDYQIKIDQIASEGVICTYPGDPDPGIPFVSKYSYYTTLTTKDGTKIRKSGDSASDNSFTICAYSTANANYQFPAQYGYISIKVPNGATVAKVMEIDKILSSLEKI